MNAPADRPLFIAQDKLTQWEGEGKVTVAENVLTLVAEHRSYQLTEAVRFIKVLGADGDPLHLIGRVRTRDQLRQMKAEHYMGSVILGDVGYEVQEGYVGNVLGAPAPTTATVPKPRPPVAAAAPVAAPAEPAPTAKVVAPPPPAPQPAPAAPAPAAEKPANDAEMLADFLLANLTG